MDSIQSGILPVRDHLPDLRRGNDLFAALRGFLHGTPCRRFCGYDCLPAAACGGPCLGLAERGADVEVRSQEWNNGPMEQWAGDGYSFSRLAAFAVFPAFQFSSVPVFQFSVSSHGRATAQ